MKEVMDRKGRGLSETHMVATGPWSERQGHLLSVGISVHGVNLGCGFCACGHKAGCGERESFWVQEHQWASWERRRVMSFREPIFQMGDRAGQKEGMI